MPEDTCPRDAHGFCLLAFAAVSGCLGGRKCGLTDLTRDEKLDALELQRQRKIRMATRR